tara:strand:- start:284 stop:1000 length:717 start_codon:yes stop_codon:yes gene_type:complete
MADKIFTPSERKDLINMLTHHEGGFHTVAYPDTKDMFTAGVGVNLSTVPDLTEDQKTGKAPIDADRLKKLFNKRLNTATNDAIKFVGSKKDFQKLSKVRQSVLVQMAFNLGAPKLNSFTRFKAFTKLAIHFKGTDTGLPSESTGSISLRKDKDVFVKSPKHKNINKYWLEAAKEMGDSQWAGQTGTRALDLQKSFLADQYYIDDKVQTHQTLQELADKKNNAALISDNEKKLLNESTG